MGGGLTEGPFSAVVKAIVVAGSNVFVGGDFNTAGNIGAIGVARWDGTNWSPVGGGISATSFKPAVYGLAYDGTSLYVGGNFTMAGSVSANNLAQWDGQSWSPFGTGPNSTVHGIAVYGNELFIGGNFTSAGSQNAVGIARWLGGRWWPVGSSGVGGNAPCRSPAGRLERCSQLQ